MQVQRKTCISIKQNTEKRLFAMNRKLVCLGIALVMLFSMMGLSACDLGNDLEVEMAEIVSIHFFTTKSVIGRQIHQFYDFTEMTYSTKTIIVDDEEEQEKYAVKSIFTDEQATVFFKNVKKQGLFSLKDSYRPGKPAYDGHSWDLEIQLKDGTTFKSSGYIVYPKEAEELDKTFFELSGYKLFGV